MYRRDRGNNSRAGGVVVYISESLPAIRRNDIERANIEGIWTEILQPHAKKILLGTIYRPPDGSDFLDAIFMEALDEVLHIASAEEKEVIIMGDLNCNFMSGAKSHSEINISYYLNCCNLEEILCLRSVLPSFACFCCPPRLSVLARSIVFRSSRSYRQTDYHNSCNN